MISVAAVLAAGVYLISRPDPDVAAADSVPATTGEPGGAAADVGPPPSVEVADVARPTRGGSVVVGVVGSLDSLNPLLTSADRSIDAIAQVVAASALRLDPDSHDLIPAAFESVPTVGSGGLTINSDGSMTVRAEIADEAFWSDGKKISGADFDHTYELVQQHRSLVHPDVVATYDTIVPGSLTTSARAVEFTLRSPTLGLGALFAVLVPAHAVPADTFPTDWDEAAWPSGGPFVVDTVQTNRLELLPNPEYRYLGSEGEALPRLDSLTVVFFPTTDDAISAFSRGEIDVIGPVATLAHIEAIVAVDGVSMDVRHGPGWEHISFQFGPGAAAVNPESVVDRRAIRRAIYSVLDRRAIVEAVQGAHGEPLDSIVGVGWPGAGDGLWSTIEPRPGVLTGVTIVLATTGGNPDRQIVIEAVREQLTEAGAIVVVETDEAGRFFGDMVLPGRFEAAEWAWVSQPGPGGTVSDILSWFTDDGPQALDFAQWSGHEDGAAFAALVTGLGVLLNLDDVEERLLAAEEQLADQVPLIPLYADLNVAAAWHRVQGYSHSALPGGILATAHQWFVVDE